MTTPIVYLEHHATERDVGRAHDLIGTLVNRAAREIYAERERLARQLWLETLPRPLRRLVDHPRLLAAYARLRPRAVPVMSIDVLSDRQAVERRARILLSLDGIESLQRERRGEEPS